MNVIESEEFGKVAFICVGATMVASIVYTGMQQVRFELFRIVSELFRIPPHAVGTRCRTRP